MTTRNGFTLIELLIVLVIIGILSAIAIPQFSATRERAYFAAMKSDVRNLASQQELLLRDQLQVHEFARGPGLRGIGGRDGDHGGLELGMVGGRPLMRHWGKAEGCAMYYGTATAPTLGTSTPKAEGQVLCTS